MRTLRRYLSGGIAANEQLTALAAAALLLLLAVEGATLLRIDALMTVHAFVGMLLIPVVALKLGSAAWRALWYYRGAPAYVDRGPPQLLLRAVVAPVVVLSTAVLFSTGVALLAVDQTHGTLVGLHKASFVVWLPATSVHVLAHLRKLPVQLARRLPRVGLRVVVLAAAVTAGMVVAVATLPAADRLQDAVSGQIAIDDR